MVQVGYGDSFVMADMPGLIEGAHSGAGLGIQFLRHIERTRVLLHILDMSELEGRDPYEDYKTINDELESYNLRLMERPQLIVANKMDMPEAAERLAEFKEKLAADLEADQEMPEIFEVSGLTKTGLQGLLARTSELLAQTPEFLLYDEDALGDEVAYYGFEDEEKPFKVSRDDDGGWRLSGEKIENSLS